VSGKRVMVVDDDAAIRETFQRQLTRWGYAVTVVESVEDALGAIQSVEPAVVVTDVRMRGMSGLELLGLLRERAPDIDVVVMTAFEEMKTAVAAMKAGAFEYLVKPLDLDHIELVLQRCFEHRALRRRVQRLAEDAGEGFAIGQIAGRDAKMIEIYKMIGQVSRSRAPVLVRGETGTGKELIARAIHFNSGDADEPFIAVNCTAIPESLLESELFGHQKGAFTGAIANRKGRFALAGRGTIFLDEIGDTSGAFQAKLLRVLQDQEFTPVGADRAERTEARVIAATHRNLEALVRDRAFREDLYFRLRVVEIRVPSLRDRKADIPLLVDHFIRKAARTLHQSPRAVSKETLARLVEHGWPGNVRELENTITRAMVLARGGVLELRDLESASSGTRSASAAPRAVKLRDVEGEHVARILKRAGGNKRKAASVLGISRARLDRLIARHRLAGSGASSSHAPGEHGLGTEQPDDVESDG
jgi:DNA-binding NtrC family response regulator